MDDREPKVFVANQPTFQRDGNQYDVSHAGTYGEIVFVFTEADPKPSREPREAWRHADMVLNDAEPGDFLVIAGGDPLGIAFASALIEQYTEGRFNFLMFNRGRSGAPGYYTPVAIDTTEWEADYVD